MAAEIPDGAFIVARAIFNSSLWTMRNEDRIMAITLLGLANHKAKRWFDGKDSITIQRGQLVRSLRDLSESSRLSIKSTRTSLKRLEKCGFLAQKRAQDYILYTIPKYPFYQDLSNYSDSSGTETGKQRAQTGQGGGKGVAQTGQGVGTKQEGKELEEGREGEKGASPPSPPPPHSINPHILKLAQLWNKSGGAYMTEPIAAGKITWYEKRGVKVTDIESAFLDQSICAGKTLWEVLDPLCPNGDGVERDRKTGERIPKFRKLY